MTYSPAGTEGWVRWLPWNMFEMPRAWRMTRYFTKGKSCLTSLFFSDEITGSIEKGRSYAGWKLPALPGPKGSDHSGRPAGHSNKRSTSGTAAARILFSIFIKYLCSGPEWSPLTNCGWCQIRRGVRHVELWFQGRAEEVEHCRKSSLTEFSKEKQKVQYLEQVSPTDRHCLSGNYAAEAWRLFHWIWMNPAPSLQMKEITYWGTLGGAWSAIMEICDPPVCTQHWGVHTWKTVTTFEPSSSRRMWRNRKGSRKKHLSWLGT